MKCSTGIRTILIAAAWCFAIALSASGAEGTVSELVKKVEKAGTQQDVEAALGKANKVKRVYATNGSEGLILTYKATDGEVSVYLLNGKVTSIEPPPKK